MASIIVHATYDGHAFVPTQPVELPVGSKLTGIVEASVPPNDRVRPQTPEAWQAFVSETAGSWAGFAEYEDPEELPHDREDSAS